MDTGTGQPTSAMMEKVRFDIFKRIFRGEVDYEADRHTLEAYIQLAEDNQDVLMQGNLHLILALLHEFQGNFSLAMQQYDIAYALYESLAAYERMGTVQVNIGDFYRLNRHYDKALIHFEQARQLYEACHERGGLFTLRANKGLTLLALGRLEEAEDEFLDILAQTAADPWEYMSPVMDARRGLAEIALARHDFAEGWTQANIALRVSSGMQDQDTLAHIYLTCAHLAEADPHAPQSAESYYHMSYQTLSQGSSPRTRGTVLLHMARYYARQGETERARDFAQQACVVFEQLNMGQELSEARAIWDA